MRRENPLGPQKNVRSCEQSDLFRNLKPDRFRNEEIRCRKSVTSGPFRNPRRDRLQSQRAFRNPEATSHPGHLRHQTCQR